MVKLQLGDKANIKLDAYPNRMFNGIISEIAGRADIKSQTFEIDISIADAPKLYSGLIAHARITPSIKQSLSKIPLSALIQANGNQGQVYVVDTQGSAQLKKIEIAYLDGAYALVSQGLVSGEWLIVQGGSFIRQDSKIRVTNQTGLMDDITSNQVTLINN